MNDRDSFGSQFGALVAMAGSAIGLGNMWRFPYLVGTNGGAAFIIIYIVLIIFITLPIFFSEYLVGRISKANTFRAFKKLAPSSHWGIVGILAAISPFLILSFYCVVGGWSLYYLLKAVTLQLESPSADYSAMFTNFVSGKYEPLLFLFLYLFLNGWVVTSGIKNGIEKFSKIIMPLLIIMVMFIAIWSMTLPGAGAGLKFLFYPDFSKVTPHTFLAAIGQSFFSLSLGCGTMLTYASYIKEKSYVVPTCIYTATADTLFAILAGMAIMPAVFAYGISPSQGPGLVFVTLPYIFSHMPLGTLFATLFFFSIFLAAITSSISILEVPVTFILEEFKIKRKTAVKICLSVITVTGILCSLSEGLLKNIHIFGKDLFDLFDFSSSNIFMTTTALLTVIFVGWKMKKGTVTNALSNNGKRKINPIYVTGVYYTIKYIAPVIVAVIMIRGLF